MTGLQALERAAPDKPAIPGHTAKQEFEYIRHGTTTLIGTFHVLTGVVFATLGLTRTEADFLAHVMRTVARDPSAGWVFVVDCLNIHGSASLVEWVARECGLNEPLGKKKPERRAAIAGEPPSVPVGPDAPHPLPDPQYGPPVCSTPSPPYSPSSDSTRPDARASARA